MDDCAHTSTSGGGGVVGSRSSGQDDYDLPLHLAAVAIMFLISLAGALAPVALRLSSSGAGVGAVTRLGTFFGFGTILATALIHMLPPAAEALASPCLPAFFVGGGFHAWAYLFLLLAVLLMHMVDYLIKGVYQRREQQAQEEAWQGSDSALEHEGCHAHHFAILGALVASKGGAAAQQQQEEEAAVGAAAAAAAEEGHAGSSSCDSCCSDAEDADSVQDVQAALRRPLLAPVHKLKQQQGQQEGVSQQQQQQQREISKLVGVLLTEAGIIFHSVMIGLTLGVTAGPAFKGLLIALCLHQFFEGFAIGSASVNAGLGAAKAAAMGVAYSVTTPAGIAVGIALRESFDARSGGALLASGICDSVSAGVLIYVVLVGLMTPMMTDSRWLRSQRWPMQVAAFAAFYAGAGVMVLLGRWA